MFSKFKTGTATPQNIIDTNPIIQFFEIGKQTASAGPELVWKIYDAYKKSDGKVSRILIFLFNFTYSISLLFMQNHVPFFVIRGKAINIVSIKLFFAKTSDLFCDYDNEHRNHIKL